MYHLAGRSLLIVVTINELGMWQSLGIYLHLLLHKPVVIENIVHLNRTSRETSCWKTGALKRAVSRVSVKETGVRPSMLACNLVLFVCHNSVIIHITIALSLKKHKQTTEVKQKSPFYSVNIILRMCCVCHHSQILHLLLKLFSTRPDITF